MKKFKGFLAVIFLVMLPGSLFAASYDTAFRFSTIETPHFQIHYHEGLKDLAERAAVISEETYVKLGKYYSWMPVDKTQVVIADKTDYAVGQVYPVPYGTIYIFPGQSSLSSTIGEYDDWLRALIVHEYTHIVTMDETRGVFASFRSVFGKPMPFADPAGSLIFLLSSSPNLFTPRWWFEGVATWTETEFTRAGRGRSVYYDMIFRSAAADDNFLNVGQIGGEVPYWPGPGAQYVYGMKLQEHIAAKYGLDAPGRLAERHSERFPYFLNGAPEGLFDNDNYIKLYDETISEIKAFQKKRIAELSEKPFTQVRKIADESEFLSSPRWSPDSKMIAYTSKDPNGHTKIVIRGTDKEGDSGQTIVDSQRRRYSDGSISWSPDSKQIYFSQYELFNGYDVYADLYSYALKERKLKQLTRGLRVSSPDVSPDNSQFAVVLQEAGSSNIAILSLDGDIPSLKKITDYKWERLSSPRWSPDGSRIAFARKRNDGVSGIYVYDVREGVLKPVVEGKIDYEYPAWGTDGKTLVYVSDETGVFNIFSYSFSDDGVSQITHLLTGAFNPDVAPDNKTIAFSYYNSRGASIDSFEYSRASGLSSPVLKPYWKQTGAEAVEAGLTGENALSVIEKHAPYSAMPTIAPRFWLPTTAAGAGGEDQIGVYTWAQDALAYHTYSIALAYAPGPKKLFYDATYKLDYFYPELSVRAISKPVYYSNLIGTTDYFERDSRLDFTVTLPRKRLESYHALSFGYQLRALSDYKGTVPAVYAGPAVFKGRRDNLFLKLDFDTALRYGYSISREEGARLGLVYSEYLKAIGSDIDGRELRVNIEKFHKLPFSEEASHAVIYYNLRGGVSGGYVTAQQSFQVGGIPNASEFPVRGVSSRVEKGKYAASGSVELRIPVVDIFQGWDTKPFYFDKLHAAFFADAGQAWGDNVRFSAARSHAGVGMEVRMDMTLGYQLQVVPTIGVAKGVGKGDKGGAAYLTVNTLY